MSPFKNVGSNCAISVTEGEYQRIHNEINLM